jgi:hypothetical protein
MSQMEKINHLLHGVPENQLYEVMDFLMFLRLKNDKSVICDIETASLSSTGFWDNADDEVWNHV